MIDAQYILQSDAQASERLKIQHKLYEKSSQRLLLDAGLKAGMRVLEVGCGPGLMTPWLCEQVGQLGHLIAIDIDPSYIEQARQNTTQFVPVEIKLHDVHTISELTESFDLIYCRMILHHLHDPQFVLAQITDRLLPSGILVCEEPPALAGVFSYPESKALTRFKKLAIQCFEYNKIEYQIAYTLPRHMQQLGFSIKIQQVFTPLLDANTHKLHLMSLRDLSPQLINCGLIDQDGIKNLSRCLEEEMASVDTVSLYQMFQVVGVKTPLTSN